MIIAIDGPAGTGKSTVAKLVAKDLGFTYLDTGAMYRAVACRALQTGVDVNDAEAVALIAKNDPIEFSRAEAGAASRVLIAGEDVTEAIRTPQVDANVSVVSAVPAVREALTAQQRSFAANNDIVMEGRDIGTVVFPDAEVKVFLTATAEERARRRALQNARRKSGSTDPAVILEEIRRRDEYDSTRETAPLKAADDAVTLDTTDLTIDEVVECIVVLATKQGGAA